MNCNVEGVMWKTRDMNPIIWMFLKFIFFLILVHKLSKYMKIVKIVMVQMLGLVEDEKTFSNLIFMKNKMCNWLTTHLDLYVYMFTQNFQTLINFPYHEAIVAWKEICIKCHVDC
jgi:hypothetical protein